MCSTAKPSRRARVHPYRSFMKPSVLSSLIALMLPIALHAQAPATPAATPAKVPWKRVMPETPPGFTLVTKDVAVYPEHTVTLTLYVPEKAGKYPAVLDIHGGGW